MMLLRCTIIRSQKNGGMKKVAAIYFFKKISSNVAKQLDVYFQVAILNLISFFYHIMSIAIAEIENLISLSLCQIFISF